MCRLEVDKPWVGLRQVALTCYLVFRATPSHFFSDEY
ncbi:MAG: hypothetical protein ACI8XX_002197 [Polaribacter sp.]|jgi:hypothetical protein